MKRWLNPGLIARLLNVLWIFGLAGVLIGGYVYQFVLKETPCPFCLLQRLAMLCVAMGPLLNLRFGFHTVHYGLSLCGIIFGGSISISQISSDSCPSLYVGAFFTFVASLVVATGLLLLYSFHDKKIEQLSFYEKGAFLLIFAIAILNGVTTLISCGLGSCIVI